MTQARRDPGPTFSRRADGTAASRSPPTEAQAPAEAKVSEVKFAAICARCSLTIGGKRVSVGGKVFHEHCNPLYGDAREDVLQTPPDGTVDYAPEPASAPDAVESAELKDCVKRLGSENATAVRVAQNLIAKGWIRLDCITDFGQHDRANELVDCIKECL